MKIYIHRKVENCNNNSNGTVNKMTIQCQCQCVQLAYSNVSFYTQFDSEDLENFRHLSRLYTIY